MTSSESDFLFVNENSDSPAYKVGFRPDVRSHIRRHVARGSKQKPKTGQQKEVAASKQKQSTCQNPCHNTAKHQPHDDCNLSTLVEESILVATGPEKNQQGDEGDAPHETEPQDTTLSDPQQPGLKKSNANGGSNDRAKSRDLPRDPRYYCKACGGEMALSLDQRLPPNENRTNVAKGLWKYLSQLSPREVLGSGRVDPFSSFSIEADNTTHELMDLSATYLIPGLMPDDKPHQDNSLVSTIARAWVSGGVELSFLLNSFLFAATIERDFLRNSKLPLNAPYVLAKKVLAIQKLNEFISERSNAERDEVLLTILILASHDNMNGTEEVNKPFNSPLKTIQWLNIYGNVSYVPEHMKALKDLVDFRGGLEKIKLPGLADLIVLGDVISAVNTFSKPTFPPLQLHEAYIASVNEWAASSHHMPTPTLATGFRQLRQHGINDALFEVLEAIGATALAFSHHLQGKPAGLTIGQIAKTRTAVQKRLLFLPAADELDATTATKPDLYECCRLAAIIFSVGVIFPIPNTYDVLQNRVQSLEAAIEASGIQNYDDECEDVLLWILVLGGIAALDKPERIWFVLQLVRVVERSKMEWDAVEKTLDKFLWLDSACGAGGHALWAEVMNIVA